MANFNLTKMAVNMHCPGNVVQLDDAGLPSILVYIPAFKNSDVLTGGDDSIHPAFIVNGVQIPGFYYSKYQNVVYDGKAYSLPAEKPGTYVTQENANKYCNAKGYGWHLSTAVEWAAIALWCKKNGFLPKGCNDFGKDKSESSYKAVAVEYNTNGMITHVATGTGPITWSHDNTPSGIWDMNGNVWERMSGIRFVWGELQILANNDAADPDNPQNETSTCWKAINASTGSLVNPESKTTDSEPKSTGNTVKINFMAESTNFMYSNAVKHRTDEGEGCPFWNVSCDSAIGDSTKKLLRALALLPDEGVVSDEYQGDYMYANNVMAECLVNRGGGYNSYAPAGIFALDARYERSRSAANLGFRASYIPNI